MTRPEITDDWSYLGDGAYVHIADWGCVTLATHDGLHTTNVVVLEPAELMALARFMHRDLPKNALTMIVNSLKGNPHGK